MRDLNTWNSSEIGNYWSDYEGEDADGDGVGDTPYLINSHTGSMDYLPVTRSSDFPEFVEDSISGKRDVQDYRGISGRVCGKFMDS